MPDSSIPASPYETLGVSTEVSMDELRRAYRRRLRETHPDTGGEAIEFHAVQVAWETIGTPEDRAAFDSRHGAAEQEDSEFVASAGGGPSPYGPVPTAAESAPPERTAPRQADAEPTARAYGHPGGWNREEYYHLMREWVGRGAIIENPYDQAMIRASPREIRHLLADANAEEETARTLSRLDISYTIWHDVDSDGSGPGAEGKIDHIVLGPTGLFAILSEDWGGVLQIRRGEIVSDVLAVGERPFYSLARRIRSITRGARAKFTALVIVVPDGSTAESIAVAGREKGVPTVVVQASRLHEFIELGLAGSTLNADEIFALRERLHQVIRFI
jgi:curved DNA-binding protein CbpA